MRLPGGSADDIRRTADAVVAEMLPGLAYARRAENVAAAATVHSIHELAETRLATEHEIYKLDAGDPDIAYARRAVECEAAVALSLSKTVTRDMITVGAQLAWRLPAIDAAFTSGDLDFPRARAIALTLEKASDATAAALEADVLAAALRTNTRSLKERIWKAWYLHDADEAAAAQRKLESEERCADVRRSDDGTATLIAKMSALEGAECNAVLEELTGTVCARDPRTKKQLRGFALLALVHREEYIACRCRREECPVRGATDQLRERRTPLIQVMVDVETLLGLTNEPATLSDGTVLDPEIARQIAGSARWQFFLTEMLEAVMSEIVDKPEGDEGSPAASPDGCAASPAASPDTRVGPTGRARARRIVRRGKVHPGASVPTTRPMSRADSAAPGTAAPGTAEPGAAAPGTAGAATGHEEALSMAIAEFLNAVAADPTLAQGIHPDGHGGFAEPPPGALTYRPSAELVALTRATHCTCTFPGCSVPAARCEIDHIVPFDRDDPAAGGWTILSNLQPLCKFHHQAKTMKLWASAKLLGDSIYWVSTSGLHHITPSTFGTVMVPDTFTHNTPNRPGRVAQPGPDTFDLDGDSESPSPPSVPLEHRLSDAVYEPTWWEIHICETDSSWTEVANLQSPVAGGTMRIPSLGDIARMTDEQERIDAVFIRRKFLEHRDVIAARERRNYRAPF